MDTPLAPAPARSLPWPVILACVLAVGAASFALHYPERAALSSFLLTDAGASLKGDALVEAGLRPGVDFGYTYGPLSLVLGRVTYGLLGRTATAHLAIVAVLALAAFAGLARCVSRVRGGWPALALGLVLTQPLVHSFGFNLTYGAEAALLMHALASHLEEKRGQALVLCVLAALVKPSMGLLYGLVLVVWIVRRSTRVREAWRQLWPAAVAAVLGVAVCVAFLGFQGTLRTAVPLVGVTHYAARASSLTRLVQSLVAPSGVNFRYYVGTLAGFWVLASGLLLLGVLRPRVIRGFFQRDTWAELAVTCAALHLAFATLFFGPWLNYLGLLVVGVFCVIPQRSVRWALVAVAAVGTKALMMGAVEEWKQRTPEAGLLGTWARASEKRELEEALHAAGGRPLYFMTTGYPEGMVPGSRASQSWFLVPGVLSSSEEEAIAREARASPAVILPSDTGRDGLLGKPWVSAALAGHTLAYQGKLLTVFVKDAAPVESPRGATSGPVVP